jgi:hypothetical protein
MPNTKIVYRGETAFIEAETPLPLADYENVFLLIYDIKKNPIIKACLVEIIPEEGEEEEWTTDNVNITGEDTFELLIPAETTAEMAPGFYWGEMKTQFEDLELDEFIFDIEKNKFLFKLNVSEFK